MYNIVQDLSLQESHLQRNIKYYLKQYQILVQASGSGKEDILDKTVTSLATKHSYELWLPQKMKA